MTLPAGLVNNDIEMFVHDGKLLCIKSGKAIAFGEMPGNVIAIIARDMDDHNAIEYAAKKAGSDLILPIIEQYAICNFGGFSKSADITEDGKITHEYFDCGERGTCPYEGKLCKHVKVKYGFLSPREIIYLQHVARGLLNKEIATQMNISEETVPSYSKSIQEKTGLHTKPEMVALAYELALL